MARGAYPTGRRLCVARCCRARIFFRSKLSPYVLELLDLDFQVTHFGPEIAQLRGVQVQGAPQRGVASTYRATPRLRLGCMDGLRPRWDPIILPHPPASPPAPSRRAQADCAKNGFFLHSGI